MANVKASTQYKRENKPDYGREKIDILYEDEWICVIYKPSGLLSVPYPGSKVRTAQSVLEDLMRKRGLLNSHHKPFVVHRLDRDTSGVMMFALTEQAQKIIMDKWHTMVTERLYHAVAENRREKGKYDFPDLSDSGLIDDPLAQNAHNVGFVPKKGELNKDGKEFKTVEARTNYKKLIKGPTHTLFELSLDTGKKNQIRAHLAAHGYPLAGDEEHRARTDNFHRLCLHAQTLEFDHPFTHEHLKFEVPEPEDWAIYVERGDKRPQTPLWVTDFSNNHFDKKRKSDNSEIKLGQKRLSKKMAAHMNFIEAGKRR